MQNKVVIDAMDQMAKSIFAVLQPIDDALTQSQDSNKALTDANNGLTAQNAGLTAQVSGDEAQLAQDQTQFATDQAQISKLTAQDQADAAAASAAQAQLVLEQMASEAAAGWLNSPNVQIWDDLQMRDVYNAQTNPAGWVFPKGNVGDSGGGNKLPAGTWWWVPGTPTTPAQYSWLGGHPYNGIYAYLNLTPRNPNWKYFRCEGEYSCQSDADLKLLEAFEIDTQDSGSGIVFNGALQHRLKGENAPCVNDFNYAQPNSDTSDKWKLKKNIPFDPSLLAGGKHVRFAIDWTKWNSKVLILSQTLNGVRYPTFSLYNSILHDSVSSNYLHAAIQLDATSTLQKFTMLIHKFRFMAR